MRMCKYKSTWVALYKILRGIYYILVHRYLINQDKWNERHRSQRKFHVWLASRFIEMWNILCSNNNKLFSHKSKFRWEMWMSIIVQWLFYLYSGKIIQQNEVRWQNKINWRKHFSRTILFPDSFHSGDTVIVNCK